ncbi:MAG: DMT family transporter [Synechococcales bacterium]|nr:DMT family transporter [Synechococcales bacterium]
MQSHPALSKSPFATMLLIAPFFLWGTAMVAMKGVMAHTTPLFVATTRLLPAGVLVLAAAAWMGRSHPKSGRAWGWILLFAIVDGALFQGFLAEGLARTGAGLGSVMIDSQPLAVALMARVLFGERIGPWGFLGLGFGIVGISLIGLPDDWIVQGLDGGLPGLAQRLSGPAGWDGLAALLQQLFHSGEWLMLMAALSMAVGTVMVRYVSRHADPVVATGWHMVLGGVMVAVASGVQESHQWVYLTTSDWTALAYSTIFGSAIAYGLFFYFASSGNLTSLIALTFLTPVFALLFGNLLLAEVLSPIQWGGVGLTLVSIYLINQREVLTQWGRPAGSPSSPEGTQAPLYAENGSGLQPSALEANPSVSGVSSVQLDVVESSD